MESDMVDAGNTLLTIGKIVFVGLVAGALLGYRHDGHEIVVASAISAHAASPRQDSATSGLSEAVASAETIGEERQQGEAGKREPEGNVPDLTY
jgi:hypothetical protein